uniref:Xylose isomerase-like TIM barrel domain-containing protein n=1 Tax=Canis lupus familiaris TaxID=9615 RepID=A0A8C0QCC4_CANLF
MHFSPGSAQPCPACLRPGSALPAPARSAAPSRGSALPARPAAPSPPGIGAPRPPRCTLPSRDPRSPPAPLHPPLPGSALPAPARSAAPSLGRLRAPRPPRCTLPSRAPRSPPAPLHPPLRGSALPARPAYFRSPSGPDSALLQGPRRPWLRSVSRPTCRGCSPSSPGSPRGCGRPAARASRRPRWPGRTRSRPRQWLAPRGKRGCGWCSSTRPPVRRGAGAGAVVRPGRRAGAEARSLSAGDREKGEMGLGAVPGRQAAFREGLEQAVLYARALGCPRIHLMAGRVPQGADRAAVRSEMETVFLENLRHAAGVLAQENLVGLLEPINTRITDPQYFLDTPQQAAAILQKVGRPNLQLQMDLFHWQIMDGNLTGNIRSSCPSWVRGVSDLLLVCCATPVLPPKCVHRASAGAWVPHLPHLSVSRARAGGTGPGPRGA